MGRLSVPGPGAYEVVARHSSPGGVSAFAWQGKRHLLQEHLHHGDPGMYDTSSATDSISSRSSHSFRRDASEGRASFNSTVARPRSAPARSARGGPGEHSFEHLYACGRAGRCVTSSFRSASPLGGHVRESSTPGVGSYHTEPARLRGLSRHGHASFAGPSLRPAGLGTEKTPPSVGPGAYDTAASDIYTRFSQRCNPRLPGFASSEPRRNHF